jgi:hypothetical protein
MSAVLCFLPFCAFCRLELLPFCAFCCFVPSAVLSFCRFELMPFCAFCRFVPSAVLSFCRYVICRFELLPFRDLPFCMCISLLSVFLMWRANLPFTIHITKAPNSLLSAFMKKLAGLCQHHECGM